MPSKRQRYGRMPSYLLKARDDEFARWKAAAAASGQTFAAYTRDALEARTSEVERKHPGCGRPDCNAPMCGCVDLPHWLTTDIGRGS